MYIYNLLICRNRYEDVFVLGWQRRISSYDRHKFKFWIIWGTLESRASWLPSFAFAAAFLLTSRWLPPISAHDQTNMPTVALDKLLDVYQGERVFHSVNWGGYLTWHGRELQPPFMNWIDDRLEVHGPEHLADYRSIMNAEFDWDKKLDSHRIDLLCLPTDAPLVGYIRRDSRWIEIYSDQHAVIYRRKVHSDE